MVTLYYPAKEKAEKEKEKQEKERKKERKRGKKKALFNEKGSELEPRVCQREVTTLTGEKRRESCSCYLNLVLLVP